MFKKDPKITYVTQPSLPDLQEFIPYLEEIWKSKVLTNGGKFHQLLEEELAKFLGVQYVSLFANGTLALLTALQTLNITGEVITTPYSFVATTHCLWWNKLKPVFVDIEADTCNLDPQKIEAAITPKTSAILPVHVYGNPCDVERIDTIAKKHKLRVIYDAAHAFGNKYKGQSVLNFGDLSILSFHATKVYNTMEGGAIISHDIDTKNYIDKLKNFGFENETTVTAPGINSKMNEMQAALGLLQLKHHQSNIEKRKEIAGIYSSELKGIKGLELLLLSQSLENYNYAYFPIFIDEKEYGRTRDELYHYLKEKKIFSRRYFYPLISQLPIYNELNSSNAKNLVVAETKSKSVICLPIYPELKKKEQERLITLIKQFKQ